MVTSCFMECSSTNSGGARHTESADGAADYY
jgi:hypothetical protein